MTFKSGLAGLAVAGTAFLWASSALSQPVAVPVAVAAPAAADPDEGLEAREAAAARAEPIPGTLNAQFAMLQANPAAAAPEPEPAPPAAAPVQPVAVEPLPPVGVKLAAAAEVATPAMATVAQAAAPSPVAAPMQMVADAPPPVQAAAPTQPAPLVQTIAYAPAAPPATPSVAVSRRVVESAAAFVAYMQRAAALKPQWADAPGVAHAVEVGGIYEQGEIEEGEIAYAALVALQDPRFVNTLRGAAVDPAQRQSLARALLADPAVALQTPGARSAAIHAATALGRLGYGLQVAGAAVKHSAYDMQHSAWSLTNVTEPQAALLRLKAQSAQREPLGDEGGRTLMASLSAPAGEVPGEVRRVTPVVARGLTLAALAVLGEAGEDRGATLLPILADASNAQCVKMARLNLYQCLSVAGPQYEDVFCLGQHAMMDTAQCVQTASGWTPAAVAPVMPAMAAEAPAATPAPASIYVPVAMTDAPSDPALGGASAYAVASASTGGER